MDDPNLHPLQTLLWPEHEISSERDLYLRLSGAAGYSQSRRRVDLESGGEVRFDTAFNLFSFGKWRRNCALSDMHLRLEGQGRFELVIFQTTQDRSSSRIFNEMVEVDAEEGLQIDLSDLLYPEQGGVLTFGLTAMGAGHLTEATWLTRQKPLREPQITLSITTFRREAAVRRSVERFEEFMKTSTVAPYLHLVVVDNGQSADIQPSQHVTPIPNENLGGSGGFARGLLEAERRGASHCLFMDDDASIHMQALERTWVYLAYAKRANTAVAGALTMANHRWAMWENGAVFKYSCKPQSAGTDLRVFNQVTKMEFESNRPAPYNFYGGWWFFAFPLSHAKYKPFPFFVRGDDISFSLVNDFAISTLPGVACFQDADFADKESLQTLYLDLRSHMVHHIALPSMEVSRLMVMSVPMRFFVRALLQCHYETAEALNLSFEDVMRGPDFFAENADMAARRADLNAIRKNEAWKKIDGPLPAERIRFDPQQAWVRIFMKLTLNGLLLPFFSRWGNRRVLQAGRRGNIRETWAAGQVTYLDGQGQYFTVRHSKLAAVRQSWRMLKNLVRYAPQHNKLQQEWREGYGRLASDDFWKARLRIENGEKVDPVA